MSDELKWFVNGKIVTPNGFIEQGSVIVQNGKIVDVLDAAVSTDKTNEPDTPKVANSKRTVIDLKGCMLVPGFIDLHMHGGAGNDVMSESDAELDALSLFEASRGVTGFLATTYTVGREKLERVLTHLASVQMRDLSGAAMLGIHLEGPFLNVARCGAQSMEYIRSGSIEELDAYIASANEQIRLMTIAPEVEGNMNVVSYAVERGITVSIGHSDATWNEVKEAVANGVTHVTHLFNGMRPLHHREPGVVGAGLALDDLVVEMICDGVHIHRELVRYVFSVKRADRIVAVSDALSPAGCPEGKYLLGGMVEAEVSGGCVRLPGGNIAGSCLTMDQSLRNTIEFSGKTLLEVLPAYTINPARQIGMEHRKGSIEIGKDADFVLLDERCQVQATYVGGKEVYRAWGMKS